MPYAYLPGFSSILRDNRMFLTSSNRARRKSVLILGTAADGPVENPIQLVRIEDADVLFGGDKAGATLLRGVHEAVAAGAGDIRMMRLGGSEVTYASLTLKDTTEVTPKDVITIRGRYPGSVYHTVKVAVTAADITVTNRAGVDHKYTLADYTTVGALINAINADRTSDVGAVLAGETLASDAIPDLATVAATALTGGKDGCGMTDANLITAAKKAYALVEDYAVDIIVPCGVYITYILDEAGGTVTATAAQDLAEHCYAASQRTGERHGIIALKPLDEVTLETIGELVSTLKKDSNPNEYIHPTEVDDSGNPLDVGKYISIICAEPLFPDVDSISYATDGAAAYAGLITTLAAESATTNKLVRNAAGVRYQLSAGQLDDITAHRYVTFTYRPGRGVTVVDGMTAAKSGSDYTRLSTVMIVNEAVNAVRTATEPFIGEAGSPQHFNSMNTAIDSALGAMKVPGASGSAPLQDYRFEILANAMDIARGEATIELILVPAFELRRIRTIVTIKASIAQ